MPTIAILGASPDPSRYSNRACRLLQNLGHKVYAVSLTGESIHGTIGVTRLTQIPDSASPMHKKQCPVRLQLTVRTSERAVE